MISLSTLKRNLTSLVKLTLERLKIGSVEITSILDEDDMASNSAVALSTQQAIKAYVDSKTTKKVESSEIALLTGDQIYTNTHGISGGADFWYAKLICKVADLDYDVGDEVVITNEHEGGYGINIYQNAAKTQIKFLQDQGIQLNRQNATTRTWIDYNDWKLVLVAVKYNA